MTISRDDREAAIKKAIEMLEHVDVLAEPELRMSHDDWNRQHKIRERAKMRLEDEVKSIYVPIRRSLVYLLWIVIGSGLVCGLTILWVTDPMVVFAIFLGVILGLVITGVIHILATPKLHTPPKWLLRLVKLKNAIKLMWNTRQKNLAEKRDPTQQLFS
jgi:hypothetical protein